VRPMPQANLKAVLGHFVAILASIITFIPVYLVMVNSVKTRAEAGSLGAALPTELHWENFAEVVVEGKLATGFLNSVLYSTVSTLIATLISAMAAFVLSRHRSRLNRLVYFFLIMGIALPINFFTLTSVMQATGLINTKLGMILLYAASQVPFSVFLIYSFIETIPRELDEAATIDGCGPFQCFFLVIMPLLTPVLVTAGLLNFLGVWSDFLFPLYFLNSSSNWPMTLAIYNFFGQFQQDWNLVAANILLNIIPVIAVYLLGQRFIISGLTGGAVKG
jgi:raffinose/stachyose/melibiose transport system permease protein